MISCCSGHAKPAPSGTRGSSPLRSSRLGPPGVAIDSTEGQASKNSSTESSVRQRTSASNGPVPEKDETEGTVSSQPSYGQTVSISRPELELRSPAVPEPRAGTAPAGNQKPSGDALQWTFASSSLTKGATLQYLNSSRPQSAYDAKLGTQGLPKGRSVLLSDRAQRPSTGKKLPKGQL